MQSFKEFVASGPAFIAAPRARGSNLGPTNPYADPAKDPLAQPNIVSIQNVRAGRVFDARCIEMTPESKKQAIEAMIAAVRSILTDETARVETKAQEDQNKFGIDTTWGKLYPNVVQFENGVKIEYWQTATQNIAGRGLWAMKDIGQRPWQVTKEKMGLKTSPEHFYKSQFENELTDLANRQILRGWPQNWEISTDVVGRGIKLLLVEPKIIQSGSA